jgi:malonyl-CoA O-methyltransferase
MNSDKQRLGYNFGRQAAQYDRYAIVQRRLADQLVQTLAKQPENFNHILEIGCGTGYFTNLLRQTFPGAEITALDLSPAVLQAARTRLGEGAGITWLVADGEQELSGCFDLITASSVFQWFTQPEQACRLYWEHLQPGGMLAFTSLGPLTFQELASSFSQVGTRFPDLNLPMIPAQGFARGWEWGDYLQQAGFREIVWQDDLWLENYTDAWTFLRAVQGMGATSTSPAFLPRGLLTEVIKHYEKNYRNNGTIQVTFEVIAAEARKILI